MENNNNEIEKALITVLDVAAKMVTTGISEDISEWKLPKTTPLKTKRKIIEEAEKWNDIQRHRASELKAAWDVLSKRFRASIDNK